MPETRPDLPMPVPPPAVSELSDMMLANQVLTSRTLAPTPTGVRVVPWIPDAPAPAGASLQFILGPDDCELPGRQKFFRGLKLYGDPDAVAAFIAFVDGIQVASGTLSASDDAGHTNLASFPRGTSGLEATIIGTCTGRMDHLDILFDPMGALEDP